MMESNAGRDYVTSDGDTFAGEPIAAGIRMVWDASAQSYYPAGFVAGDDSQRVDDPPIIGRGAVTRHGEAVRIIGRANDPARVTVIPVPYEPGVTETFTPRIADLTIAPHVGEETNR